MRRCTAWILGGAAVAVVAALLVWGGAPGEDPPLAEGAGIAASLERTLVGHRDQAWDVAFAPDGRTLASASPDGTVRVWDAATGAELASLLHPAGVTSLAWAPDGRTLASGCRDG